MMYRTILAECVAAQWRALIEQEKAIAVIRSSDFAVGLACAEAVAKVGMRLIEVTWNSHRPEELVAELRIRFPHCAIGAGTILTLDDLDNAISAGAQFVFSPHFNSHLVERCLQQQIPYIPGALSPTEVVTAYQAGASAVKVFPVSALGGSSYIKSLKSPLSDIPLIPTGGVNLKNAQEMIDAGAIAVAIAGDLFPSASVEMEDWEHISDRASYLVEKLRDGKPGSTRNIRNIKAR